jgi:hypothetical protein
MTEGTENTKAAASQTRRQLLRFGLAAAPVLVTIRARPAFAESSLGSIGIAYGAYTASGQALRVNSNGDLLDVDGNVVTNQDDAAVWKNPSRRDDPNDNSNFEAQSP